jgi:hypothetical protein
MATSHQVGVLAWRKRESDASNLFLNGEDVPQQCFLCKLSVYGEGTVMIKQVKITPRLAQMIQEGVQQAGNGQGRLFKSEAEIKKHTASLRRKVERMIRQSAHYTMAPCD